MITETERKYLLDSMESLLYEYDYKFELDALNDILDKCRDDQLVLKEGFKAHNITEDEYRSGIILTWKETILSIGKIYWKSLALAVAGILFIKHGHSILMNRLNTITALYMSAKSLIEKDESDKDIISLLKDKKKAYLLVIYLCNFEILQKVTKSSQYQLYLLILQKM